MREMATDFLGPLAPRYLVCLFPRSLSSHPLPPYAEKTACETVKLATPRTSTRSSGYAHRAANSQKHRICETVSVLEPMSNHCPEDSAFTVSQIVF
jgi:hypothetical protein